MHPWQLVQALRRSCVNDAGSVHQLTVVKPPPLADGVSLMMFVHHRARTTPEPKLQKTSAPAPGIPMMVQHPPPAKSRPIILVTHRL